MAPVAFYETDKGIILCDPCSAKVCVADASIAMHRTYKATDLSNKPTLTCEMCGERHQVSQS